MLGSGGDGAGMPLTMLSRYLHPDPRIRRELVDLLYTSLPQVSAIGLTSVTGAVALAVMSGDIGYAVISVFIFVTAAARIYALFRYRSRAAQFSDADVIRWERLYGAGASAFGLALGMLSYRALEIDDDPGAWVAFGLSMSFCVGMVSRAAIRPWIILNTAAILLMPTIVGGLLRPEFVYKIGALMLVFFWLTLREASRHLSAAFVERLEAKHRLARQATHDFLTGLPNRAAFFQALAETQDDFAIVAIDLDGFKPVNDRHGHQAGDDLLRQVAERLSSCVGSVGIAARFGGDEFLMLKPVAAGDDGREQALALTRQAIRDLSMPFLLADIPVRIAASAGILVSTGPVAAAKASQLLDRVDRALYAAKRSGGGRWSWSDQDVVAERAAG